MLSEFYNDNEQAEILQPKTISLKISCNPALTNKLNTALRFVTLKMGYVMLEDFNYVENQDQYILLTTNRNKVSVELNITKPGTSSENIIFHTDDCLRDYHKYIMLGVEFVNRPEYSNCGLQVKFIDDHDNHYTLLEERYYNES
ncbi:hypothetical protein [Daejeonella lutea]|uniref:VOC domain-containing protein n=1 Tax=Daejeonella lutea TaxID=572036 RepID=A0A1T5F7B9_9SPHI|nr:hypothetical protein [Daejeonella lutea]SKB92011.1 hypothetical protein SAMN05661099_3471 [Daejeonella lutea]